MVGGGDGGRGGEEREENYSSSKSIWWMAHVFYPAFICDCFIICKLLFLEVGMKSEKRTCRRNASIKSLSIMSGTFHRIVGLWAAYLPKAPQQSPKPEPTQVTLMGDFTPHTPFLYIGALVTVDISLCYTRKLTPNACTVHTNWTPKQKPWVDLRATTQ